MDDQTKDKTEKVESNKEHLQPEQGVEVVVNEEKKDPSDVLTPDHPRFKQVIEERNQLKEDLSSLKEEMRDLRLQITERQQTTGDLTLTAEEEAQMAQIDKLLKQRGYVKEDDLKASERVSKRAIQLERLSEKYNGGNGYPKFDAGEVIAHARENGFSDEQLERAFKDLHYEAFVRIDAEKLAKSNVPDSEKPTGADRAFNSQFTRSSIEDMSSEDWEKNRGNILQRLRAAATSKGNLDL